MVRRFVRSPAPAVALSFLLLAGATAHAAPLNYTESSDFSSSAPGTAVGNLDAGDNFIRGTIGPGTDTRDLLRLTLGSGLVITSFVVTITNFAWGPALAGQMAGAFPGLMDVNGSLDLFVPNIGGDGTQTTTANYTTAGDYTVKVDVPFRFYAAGTGPTCTTSNPCTASFGSFSYEIKAIVEGTAPPPTTAPEPAAISLMGLAIAGMGMRLRRPRAR